MHICTPSTPSELNAQRAVSPVRALARLPAFNVGQDRGVLEARVRSRAKRTLCSSSSSRSGDGSPTHRTTASCTACPTTSTELIFPP